MTNGNRYRTIAIIFASLAIGPAYLSGCSHKPNPDTGAKQAAQKYLESFCTQNWSRAYAALDPDSRAKNSAEQYTQWVTDYQHRMGFDVDSGVLLWCRETGDKALAAAMLKGHAGARKLTKEIALSLHFDGGNWCVVLPAAAAQFAVAH